MTVIIVDNSNEAVEKMAVDETSSDNSYVKTPPQIRRKKKKRPTKPIMGTTFADLYKLTGETLGEGIKQTAAYETSLSPEMLESWR